MLEKLVIYNFQLHEKLVIKLSPTITSIVGESDVGKSSILRALRWLALNQPSGEEFIRHGEKSTQVSLCLDECKIIRTKGKENSYELTRGEETKLFKAFGQAKVPDEIEDTLRVTEVNFQEQHEPPFWFFLSAGEVSKQLNSIVDLSIIDDSTSRVNSEVRKAKTTLEVCEDRLKQARARKQELSWVPAFVVGVRALEETSQKLQKSQEKARRLSSLLEEIQSLQEGLQGSSETLASFQTLILHWEAHSLSLAKTEKLASLVRDIKNTQKEITKNRELVEETHLELEEESEGVCPVCGGGLAKD